MKKIYITFLLYLIFNFAHAQVTFSRVYGGVAQDYGKSVLQTFDGGYVLVGVTSSFGAGTVDVYLIKTDSLGVFQWQKTYGGNNVDQGYGIVQLNDSGFAICGFTNSFGLGGYDAYLIRTNSSGDTVWTRTYEGMDWDFIYSIQTTPDFGFILVGETYTNTAGMKDALIIKTDSVGNLLWKKTFGGSDDDGAKSRHLIY